MGSFLSDERYKPETKIMSEIQWTAVDNYISNLFVPADPILDAVLQSTVRAGMPLINVSAAQGKLLQILALSIGARSILEIGTLAGYSTIFLARGLKDGGRITTLEADPKHAAVAKENISRAGLMDKVEIRIGRALDTLPKLAGEGRGPFDLVFIDADKPNTAAYFAWAVRLARPGTIIVTDNVVRKGAVADPNSQDENVRGMRQFNAAVAATPNVTATVIQTVGSKGYDGFSIAFVNTP